MQLPGTALLIAFPHLQQAFWSSTLGASARQFLKVEHAPYVVNGSETLGRRAGHISLNPTAVIDHLEVPLGEVRQSSSGAAHGIARGRRKLLIPAAQAMSDKPHSMSRACSAQVEMALAHLLSTQNNLRLKQNRNRFPWQLLQLTQVTAMEAARSHATRRACSEAATGPQLHLDHAILRPQTDQGHFRRLWNQASLPH